MEQGKRTKEAQGDLIQNSSKIGGPFKFGPPTYQDLRLELFDKIFNQQQELMASAEHKPIVITLKDGKQIQGLAFETTPMKIALSISKKLAGNSTVAKVKYSSRILLEFAKGEIIDTDKEDGPKSVQIQESSKFELWDLHRPLEGDCNMDLLSFDDPQGKETFWHSSAHLLGASLEAVFGCHLCIGPPIENGFFYDSYIGDHKIFPTDYEKIEKTFQKLSQEKMPFQRAVLTKAQALELFKFNPFKVQLITNKIPDNGITTAYKCGKLIDLCTGPHLPSTERVKAFQVTKNSAAYWLGKNTNDDLQRVYAISFPDNAQLKEYVKIQEELAKRDHRNVGKQQQLFLFNPLSPGSAFFYPDGAHIYNTMMNFIRGQYVLRGFQEVITPNFYNVQLWKISGHYDKYKENMFLINMGDEGEFGVKPMNCPGHCLMFDMIQHSFRDLPIRYADFGVLHRNEVHGALSGLTRVRRFQQDDAHIFCRTDQLQQEIISCLDFLAYVYQLFGFEYKLYLSTRPATFLGTKEIWDNAEEQLMKSLDSFGRPYEINEGDGAFYGPKIDVKLYDAYKREHQCGTIQLDFNLPERFNLQYRASEDTDETQKEKVLLQKDQSDQSSSEVSNKTGEEVTTIPKEPKQKGGGKKQQPPVETNQDEQQKGSKPKNQGGETLDNEEKIKQKEQRKKDNIEKQMKKAASSEVQLQQSGEQSSEQLNEPSNSEVQSVLHEKKYDIGHHHIKPGFQRPIIVHRAIYGSFERFVAILTEQYGGKWPFWLSPKQISICPISMKYGDYASKVALRLKLEGFKAEADLSSKTLNSKVRTAQLEHFNYIGVVGQEEESSGTVDVRDAEKNDRIGKFSVEELIVFLRKFEPEQSKQYHELKKQSFQREEVKQLYKVKNPEYQALDKQLGLKVFLNGDGFAIGQIDEEIFTKLLNQTIDQLAYPNLFRWNQFMQHHKKQNLPIE